jgi:hypothetical protein
MTKQVTQLEKLVSQGLTSTFSCPIHMGLDKCGSRSKAPFLQGIINKENRRLGVVAQAYNTSYLRGREQEDRS